MKKLLGLKVCVFCAFSTPVLFFYKLIKTLSLHSCMFAVSSIVAVKFLLNRVGNQNSSGVPKLDSNKKEVSGNAGVTDDTRILAKKESYLGEKAASSSGVQFDEVAKTNERQVDIFGETGKFQTRITFIGQEQIFTNRKFCI